MTETRGTDICTACNGLGYVRNPLKETCKFCAGRGRFAPAASPPSAPLAETPNRYEALFRWIIALDRRTVPAWAITEVEALYVGERDRLAATALRPTHDGKEKGE